jgi:hypothetical protein
VYRRINGRLDVWTLRSARHIELAACGQNAFCKRGKTTRPGIRDGKAWRPRAGGHVRGCDSTNSPETGSVGLWMLSGPATTLPAPAELSRRVAKHGQTCVCCVPTERIHSQIKAHQKTAGTWLLPSRSCTALLLAIFLFEYVNEAAGHLLLT